MNKVLWENRGDIVVAFGGLCGGEYLGFLNALPETQPFLLGTMEPPLGSCHFP
jgi:hypothetical protein